MGLLSEQRSRPDCGHPDHSAVVACRLSEDWNQRSPLRLRMERETGIEPATNGLGSRYSPIELLPPDFLSLPNARAGYRTMFGSTAPALDISEGHIASGAAGFLLPVLK